MGEDSRARDWEDVELRKSRDSLNQSFSWVAIILIVIPTGALLIGVIFPNPFIGGVCDHSGKTDRCRLYTASFNGYVGFTMSGFFNKVRTSTETVFTLRTDNGTFYRLIFYCLNSSLVTRRDEGNGTYGGYVFCEDVPLSDGSYIAVDGTLITPSAWIPQLSTPRLVFAGDLYVFELTSD